MSLSLLYLFFVISVGVARQSEDELRLPSGLNEAEQQLLRRERSPKGRVEAALKLAEARLLQALKQAQAGEAEAAATNLNQYGDLLQYADQIARQLSNQEKKEMLKLLKLVEQAIFKQQRNYEATRRELPLLQREATETLTETIKRIRLRALNDVLGNGEIIK